MKSEKDLFKAINSRHRKPILLQTLFCLIWSFIACYTLIIGVWKEWFSIALVIVTIVLNIELVSSIIKYLKFKPEYDLYYSYFDSSEEMIKAINETLANNKNNYKGIGICISDKYVMLDSDHTQIIPFNKITSIVKISNERTLAINEIKVGYSDSRYIDEVITMIERGRDERRYIDERN